MKLIIKLVVLFAFLFYGWSFNAQGMDSDGFITVEEDEKVFYSRFGEGIDSDEMLKLNFREAVKLVTDEDQGLIASIRPGGKVEVHVYSVKNGDSIGTKVYSGYFDTSTSQFKIKPYYINTIGGFNDHVTSTKIKTLAKYANIYPKNTCKETEAKTNWWHLFNLFFSVEDSPENHICKDERSKQPVVIKLVVKNATLKKVKIPGMEAMLASDIIPIDQWYTNPCESDPSYAGCRAGQDFREYDPVSGTIVVAHRGFHGDRQTPENSMKSLERAYDNKFRYVELDLRITKDNVPFIYHEDYLGYMTNFSALINTDSNTLVQEKNWAEISDLQYRTRYWDKAIVPAINDKGGVVNVALGEVNSAAKLTSFESVCDYIKDKDIMVFLDIKSAPMARHYETMAKCIDLGARYNVLHQLGFKMIRTGDGVKPEKSIYLYMTPDETKAQLGNHFYNKMKTNLNINVVDYQPGNEGVDTFIQPWINEGNVAGFEFDHQKLPIFNAYSMLKKDLFQIGVVDKSPWEFTKGKGYRTGIWSSTALDARGRPRHDPTQWAAGSVLAKEEAYDDFQTYKDNRARLEFINMILPQYMTHDRPDIVVQYMDAVNRLNPKTFR